MKKKKRLVPLSMEKSGEITSAGMQSQLGPVSSAVLLTQVGIPRKGKKRKKNISESIMLKASSLRLDELLKRFDRSGE